ncbi:MAG: ABC1 kinase family protein [Flavobacteriaceae bacterium]
MKTIDYIPSSKISRASKIVETGIKVGGNYLKYYGDQLTGSDKAQENLDKRNAKDVYDGLKTLKGSALKVAQMLSMEQNLIPQAYVEQFSLAQFSVPPLSPPLVRRVFKKYFGKTPQQQFDHFDLNSKFAASIGQVHKASKDDQVYAVKIQYPGVAESISSDLALVKPFALKMLNLNAKESDHYFKEVEQKLLEETNYLKELQQALEVKKACESIPGLKFPNYYPKLSSQRVLTMEWMQGKHLSELEDLNLSQKERNQIGQSLWDFYMLQLHHMKKVQADPHPGNFLVNENKDLIALDFGCMKELPQDFYTPYFELIDPENINTKAIFEKKLEELEILTDKDSPEERAVFSELFAALISLFSKPFQQEHFDFSDRKFFKAMTDLGKHYTSNPKLKKMNTSRGSKHFIYVNRTFFGLYNLMHLLKAEDIKINQYKTFI